MDCSVQALATNSNNITCCIPGRPQLNAVKIWLLATIAGVSTDPAFLRAQANCLDNCQYPTLLLAYNVYLLSLIGGASTDPATLIDQAKCFTQPCIHSSLRAAMQVWILTQIAGVSADPAFLISQAKCILECVPEGSMWAIETWLLSQLAAQ